MTDVTQPTTGDPERLYSLLPQLYRLRDLERGEPLRRLMRVLSDQRDRLSSDIDQLYDDWFIETCAEELIPYFADLVGLTLDRSRAGAAVDPGLDRAAVANAIRDRRSKGTAAALEELSIDVTTWPSRTVEVGRQITATASVRFPDLSRTTLFDGRAEESVEPVDGAFSTTARRPDLRSVSSGRTPGAGQLTSLLIDVWRLQPERVVDAPAARIAAGRYTFDVLGRDIHLAVAPVGRVPGVEPVSDLDVPGWLQRLPMATHLADYYGADRSVLLLNKGRPIPREEIVIANLSEWWHRGARDRFCLDPVLGRLSMPEDAWLWEDEFDLRVRYSRLTVGGVGAGYARHARPAPTPQRYRVGHRAVGPFRSIGAALRRWESDRTADPARAGDSVTIEIVDNDIYWEALALQLEPGQSVEIRAAAGCQPVLFGPGVGASLPLIDAVGTQTAADHRPELRFDGLYLTGGPVHIGEGIGHVTFNRCTALAAPVALEIDWEHLQDRDAAPGWPSGANRERDQDRSAPVVRVRSASCSLTVASSVMGPLHVELADLPADPISVRITDSVLDGGGERANVLPGRESRSGFAELSMARTTVFGRVYVHAVEQVEDCLILGRLDCEFRQHGHVAYSYLDPRSRTPQRDHCQPERATSQLGPLDPEATARAEADLAPHFDSTDPGSAVYARLRDGTRPEIVEGAHDGGELGAFHDLWGSRRAELLRHRLADVTPAGMDVDVRYAT